ncbi:protein FAM171A1 [Chanos chanos]|uniref:Protein FAM171A1 n=1 Tax=Chanos chanos TaxID=29144 RepID=A0A6J2W5A9_CHACN|nr:protein FAM171A1 [Chanos chanos]
MRQMSRSDLIVLLCLLGCNVWKAVTKTLQEDSDAKEVALKVHLSDASTHQPLSGVVVEIFTNHTAVAAETSSADGNVFIRFQYRLGDLLVVTATRRGYVPNSAPWRPDRLPVFSSLSLDLLPERPATLMVYEDVVEIVSGYQGSRLLPSVQFPRRALSLPPNGTYTNLTALLTVTHSPQDTQHFPYLQGLHTNTTGSDHRFELTPVAAVSVHLLGGDGAELPVTEPARVNIPLPAHSGLKENDHIPAWRFDPKLGAWLQSSLGYVQREGGDLILTYIAPQLGYWVAAMSPVNTGPVVAAKDISTYHTVFLLAILGGMALILLFLLCLLLYYCRRKCARSRPAHRKFTLSTALDSSKRDQATSMSHLILVNETHLDHFDLVSSGAEPDLHTPMLKPTPFDSSTNELLASRDELRSRGSNSNHCRRSVETFALKFARSADPSEGYDSPAARGEYRRSYTSVVSSSVHPLHASVSSSSPHPLHQTSSTGRLSSDSKSSVRDPRLSPVTATPIGPAGSPERDPGIERRPADYLLSRSVDHLERPAPLPHPGALLCCTSELQVSQGGEAYRKARPTLLIPAHYMRLPGTHPLSGQALLLQSDEQSELESIQAELNASHQPAGQTTGSQNQIDVGAPETGREGGEKGEGGGEEWTLQTASVPEALSIPNSLSQAGLGVVQMNGEDQLLAEKTLMELRGGKPLPHPRAWFVSLDGRSNAHIRHSYIDLQRAGRNGSGVGSNDASLDSGVDMSEIRPGRKGQDRVKEQDRAEDRGQDRVAGPQATAPSVAYTQLVFVDDVTDKGTNSENATPVCSPAEISQGPLLQLREGDEEEEGTLSPVSPPSALPPSLPSPPPLPEPMLEEDEEAEEESGTKETDFLTERAQTHLRLPQSNSPPNDLVAHDDSGEDENKKSPWQRREERPLMAFNLK